MSVGNVTISLEEIQETVNGVLEQVKELGFVMPTDFQEAIDQLLGGLRVSIEASKKMDKLVEFD